MSTIAATGPTKLLTDFSMEMATPETTKPITVILTGKSGAGKSTMKDTLLGNHAIQKPSPDPVTKKFIGKTFTKNGIDIHIIDTPGLRGTKEDENELKMCSAYTDGKADLLIYCLSVGVGHKFHEANPEIMKYITEGFKKQIWDHCVLVLTMSNLAYSDFSYEYLYEKPEEEYKEFLKEFADKFQHTLQELQVHQQVKTIFELETIERNNKTIIAVPAGKKSNHRVLPGLKCKLPAYCEDPTWTSIMTEVMRVTCPSELAPSILQYQYGVKKTVPGTAVSEVVSEAAGGLGARVTGAIGCVIGGIAGPIGAEIGAGVGRLTGVTVGAAIGKYKIKKEMKNIEKEVKEQQSKKKNRTRQTEQI